MRISDWSSDVCSSDLEQVVGIRLLVRRHVLAHVVGAEDAVQVAAVVVLQLELLAGLVLVHRHQHVAKLVLGGVDVDERMRLELAIRTDALEQPLRSEEHTSELQSLMRISYAGFCLKKK